MLKSGDKVRILDDNSRINEFGTIVEVIENPGKFDIDLFDGDPEFDNPKPFARVRISYHPYGIKEMDEENVIKEIYLDDLEIYE